MTRMQTLATVVLTSLGIMALAGLPLAVPLAGGQNAATSIHTLALLAVFLLQGGVVYALILENRPLVRMIVPAETEEKPAERQWCEAVMRAGMILCGLLLLQSTGKYLLQALAFLVIPTGLRQFMQDIVTSGVLVTLRTWGDAHAQITLWGTLQGLLALYLIWGAPQLVRWQIRQMTAHTTPHTSHGEVS